MTEKFQDKYRISSARLRNWDYSAESIYFITICTAGRECYFGGIVNKKMALSDIGSLVQLEWEKSFVIRAELFCDYFVIMPNHIHAILHIENGACEQNDELHNRNMHKILPGNEVETDGRLYKYPIVRPYITILQTGKIHHLPNLGLHSVHQNQFHLLLQVLNW